MSQSGDPAASSRGMRPGRIAVLGVGNMGLSLLQGYLRAHPSRAPLMVVTSRTPSRARERVQPLGVTVLPSNARAVSGADLVVLAVKPQILPAVLDETRSEIPRGATLLSLAAGVPTTLLEDRLRRPDVGVVRAMPNVAASVRASATAYCRGSTARSRDILRVRNLLESVGTALEVDESLMDAVTGLSGTGPLYLFLILEGLSDAGVKVGLSRETSTNLAIQTLVGAAQMVRTTGEHPAKLRELVTSPGGTAITALHSLERSGLKAMLIDAVEAATSRARELGERWKHPPGSP